MKEVSEYQFHAVRDYTRKNFDTYKESLGYNNEIFAIRGMEFQQNPCNYKIIFVDSGARRDEVDSNIAIDLDKKTKKEFYDISIRCPRNESLRQISFENTLVEVFGAYSDIFDENQPEWIGSFSPAYGISISETDGLASLYFLSEETFPILSDLFDSKFIGEGGD